MSTVYAACGSWALAAFTCTVAAAVVVHTVAAVVAQHHALPFWDHWDFTFDLRAWFAGEMSLARWTALHNEHPIVVPRLLYFADMLLCGGSGNLLLVAAFSLQAAHAALLVRVGTRASDAASTAPTSLRLALAGTVIVLLFSARQLDSFLWGWQVQFVLVHAAASAALACLLPLRSRAAVPPSRRALWVVSSASAAFVATFSMANGVLVWPLLLLLGWRLGIGGRALAALAASGVTATVGVLLAMRGGHHEIAAGVRRGFTEPVQFAEYVAAWLGNVFTYDSLLLGVACGGVGIALLVGLAALALAGRLRAEELVLLHVSFFVAGTAMVSAVGRAHLSAHQALSSRYVTAAAVFWASLLLVLAAVAPRLQSSGRLLRSLAILCAVAFAAASARHGPRWWRHHRLTQERVALSIMVGAVDPDALAATHGLPPQVILDGAAVLVEHRLSAFRSGMQDWPGRRIDDCFTLVEGGDYAGRCQGIAALPASPDVCKLTGWAIDRTRDAAVSRLVFTDAAGIVCGIAGGGWPCLAEARTEAGAGGLRADAAWEGYCRFPAHEPGVVTAWAVLAAGRAARLPILIDPRRPQSHVVELEERTVLVDGSGVADLSQLVDCRPFLGGAWTRDGQSPPFAPAAGAGATYGSWSGHDRNVGAIAFGPFRMGEHGAVTLPFLFGPGVDGQALRLVDVASGDTLCELRPELRVAGRWLAWHVDVPPAARGLDLSFVMVDEGREWAQWSAAATPRWADPIAGAVRDSPR